MSRWFNFGSIGSVGSGCSADPQTCYYFKQLPANNPIKQRFTPFLI